MNSIINDIKIFGGASESRDSLIQLIEILCEKFSFIVPHAESLTKKIDSSATLFDIVATEIYTDLSISSQNESL